MICSKTMRLTLGEAEESFECFSNGKLGIYTSPYRAQNTAKNSDAVVCYFETVATIVGIPHNMDQQPWYNAAPDTNNYAKVVPDGNGQWFCKKNNTTYTDYVPRYVLRCRIESCNGDAWITAFNDSAVQILNNISAATLEKYKKEGDVFNYEKVFNDALFKKFVFKLRAKSKSDQYGECVAYDCLSAVPVNWSVECAHLKLQIDLLQQKENNSYARISNDECYKQDNKEEDKENNKQKAVSHSSTPAADVSDDKNVSIYSHQCSNDKVANIAEDSCDSFAFEESSPPPRKKQRTH